MITDIGEEQTELPVSVAVGATDKSRKIDVAKHILDSSDVAACLASIRIPDYLSCSSPAGTSPSSLQQRIAVRVRLDSLRPRVHIADSFPWVGRVASSVPRKGHGIRRKSVLALFFASYVRIHGTWTACNGGYGTGRAGCGAKAEGEHVVVGVCPWLGARLDLGFDRV